MKLPVKQILKRNKYKIVDKEGFEVVSDIDRLCDAIIIEDSLNNYPKAVELLKTLLESDTIQKGAYSIDIYDINKVKEFLNQIENG